MVKPVPCKFMLKVVLPAFVCALTMSSTVAQAGFRSVDLGDRDPVVTDQGNTNLCWAHAIATALSYEIGTQISPLSVAVEYDRHPGFLGALIYNPYSFNVVFGAMQKILGRTVCPISMEPDVLPYGDSEEIGTQIKRLQNLYSLNHLFGPHMLKGSAEDIQATANSLMTGLGDTLISHMAPTKSLEETMAESMDGMCRLRAPSAKRLQVMGALNLTGDVSQVRRLIETALNENKPAIIGYFGYLLLGHELPKILQGKIPTHASVIVGRKEGPRGEMLRLRNSWGAYSVPVLPGLNVFAGDDDSEARLADNGDVWLYPDEILPYTTAAWYYKTVGK